MWGSKQRGEAIYNEKRSRKKDGFFVDIKNMIFKCDNKKIRIKVNYCCQKLWFVLNFDKWGDSIDRILL